MTIDKGDIPPGAEAAVRRFQNAMADVATQAARLRRLADEPIEPFAGVDEARLNAMARMPSASPELAAAAAAISRGECTWHEIVEGLRRQPPEIVNLIDEKIPFAFATGRLAPPGAPSWDRPQPTPDSSRHLYDDFDDEDQAPESWLE